MLNPHSVLVTGSNRGIGLEIVRQLVGKSNRPQWIFATCRDPKASRAQALKNLAAKHQRLVIIPLDVSDPSSVKTAAAQVTEQLKGAGLNLLINNAGIGNLANLETATQEQMSEVYQTNVIGSLLVSQAFLPLLKKASQESNQTGMSCSKAAIVNISSRMGSITKIVEWDVVSIIPYRCSKAALNMLTRCMSLEFAEDKILCIALHPGWVQTDMGNILVQAPMTVDGSVQEILSTLGRLSEKDTGYRQGREMEMLNPHSVLVTGSNRGIGLEIVRQLAGKSNRPQWIFAACRDPEGPHAQALKSLAAKHQGFVIVPLDVSDPSSVKTAAAQITEQLKGAGLNLLINNAGIGIHANLETVTQEQMSKVYQTNVIGSLMVSQAFLPLLKKASQESNQNGMSCSKAAIVNISSIMGTITNIVGWDFLPSVPYRCSKAALNMLTRCMSLRFAGDEILCVALHPGWVQTDMGTLVLQTQEASARSLQKPSEAHAPMAVDGSVQEILSTLGRLSEKDTGTFVSWDGKPLVF